MLRKLVKYELKATLRLLIPLYLILLIISIINRIVFSMNGYDGQFNIIGQFFMVTYITSIFGVTITTLIYMVVRFYRNLLTDEGYLMFTLPAKTHELITSKLLVTLLWTIISIAAVLVSTFIVFATPDSINFTLEGIRGGIGAFNREVGGSWVLVLVEFILTILLGIVAKILMVYASIAIGQLFSKHKIIGSFVAYIAIYTIIQFLMMILIIPIGLFMSNKPIEAWILPQLFFPITLVILAVGSVGFYFVTNYIFKRKLNLD